MLAAILQKIVMKENILAEWKNFNHLFKKLEIPSKTELLKEGEVSKKIFIIEKGIIRCWLNHLDKDITFQFFFEGDSVASLESFKTEKPSSFALETLEPSIIKYISKDDFDEILKKSPLIKEEFENYTFQRLLFYQNLFLSRIKDNPQKRYQELLKKRPEIFKRIPLHYIASYLGITPVSLSRIRGRK